jgi:hypothetical protein
MAEQVLKAVGTEKRIQLQQSKVWPFVVGHRREERKMHFNFLVSVVFVTLTWNS